VGDTRQNPARVPASACATETCKVSKLSAEIAQSIEPIKVALYNLTDRSQDEYPRESGYTRRRI